MTPGAFIQPDSELRDLADPNEKLGVPIHSGYRAIDQSAQFLGQNRLFDQIWQRWNSTDLKCEDQCSAQYYFDLFRTLRDFNGEFDHVVEVGVYMGGSTSILAGGMQAFDYTLDLVDIRPHFLQFAYERARRMYPEIEGRVRLFHGTLPQYVRHAMMDEPERRSIVHHDGAHDFNTVVEDMAALSFVREQLFAIIAQDTHLRGTIKHMNFVDMALYAVFGLNLNYAPIGASYSSDLRELMEPNPYQGNYFMPDKPEGFVLPMAWNEFHYPHPALSVDDFLPALLSKASEISEPLKPSKAA